MIDLKNVLSMWAQDCIIDEMNLDEASRQTPMLHAKYLELYSLAKLQLKKAEMSQKSLLKEKWLYYNGKMTQEDISERGWEFDPFDGLKVLKGDMDYYYDSDKDIQASEEKITYWKTVVETLHDIIDNLKWRHQNISNIIRWRQFESGG
jgi:hypothetical protein